MFHFWGSDFLGLVAYFDVVLDVDPDPEAPIPNKELYDRCRKTCIRDHNFLASHKTFHGSDLPPIVSPIVDVSQPQIVTTPHPRIVPFVPIRGSPDTAKKQGGQNDHFALWSNWRVFLHAVFVWLGAIGYGMKGRARPALSVLFLARYFKNRHGHNGCFRQFRGTNRGAQPAPGTSVVPGR